MIRVTVWNEFRHEAMSEHVRNIYPNGMHGTICDFLNKEEDIEAGFATLDMPEHGLTQEVIDNTDVLLWWGHMNHGDVSDEIVERVYQAVLKGMGLIVLHSGHHSKIFRKLMGTTCNLKWRDNDTERIWVINPGHPIAKGIPEHFEIGEQEMYGEPFDIPNPDEVVFLGWFKGGEVFRTGVTYRRGNGNIFYFQPGHEDNPTYHDPNVQKVIINAVRWANPVNRVPELICPFYPKLPEI